MKKLLLVLSLLPFTLAAQTEQKEGDNNKPYHNEIGYNMGLSSLPVENIAEVHPIVSVRYLRNYSNTQIGADVSLNHFYMFSSFSSGNGQSLALTPTLLLNHTFHSDKYYLYAGIAAGYYQDIQYHYHDISRNEKGYILGAQGGITYYIGNHISLNAELAVRSAQVWYKEYYSGMWQESLELRTYTDFRFYTPLTIGIRYRF